MELFALARREGEPVAVAYGAEWDGGAIACGLLFVQAGQRRRTLAFVNPATKARYTLALPKRLLNLDGHACLIDATLTPETTDDG